MVKKVKTDYLLLGAIALFALAAYFFMLDQFSMDFTIFNFRINGYNATFGNDRFEGRFLYSFAFIMPLIGIIIGFLRYFKIIKMDKRIAYTLLFICSVIAIVALSILYRDVHSNYKTIFSSYKMLMAFGAGFVANAFAGIFALFDLARSL